tara:strand:- start:8216 stop:9418 length:1203 start_codon:yes stop_codon:yes gene_type:complete
MKGFFVLILLFLNASISLFANVFTKNNIKLSNSVLREIKSFKKHKDENPITSNQTLKKVNTNGPSQCFILNQKINGVAFSPTKLFAPIFINDSDKFYLKHSRAISNLQIAVEINQQKSFSIYTGLLDSSGDCLRIKIPKFLDGNLVVELDDRIKNIEIDKAYEVKHLRGRYVVFKGVDFGNLTLKFETKDNKFIQNIIHLHEGITQFVPLKVELLHRRKVSGQEIKLMASKKQDINLSKLKFENFFSKKKFQSKEKHVSFSEEFTLSGFNRLIKIEGDDLSFLSFSKNKDSFLKMNEEYLKYFLSINNYEDKNDLCLIHFPVGVNLIDASFIHSTGRQEGEIDLFFLNHDGSISNKLKRNSHQILIAGYSNGAVDYRFEFENKVKYGQSLCALGTYLIEN